MVRRSPHTEKYTLDGLLRPKVRCRMFFTAYCLMQMSLVTGPCPDADKHGYPSSPTPLWVVLANRIVPKSLCCHRPGYRTPERAQSASRRCASATQGHYRAQRIRRCFTLNAISWINKVTSKIASMCISDCRIHLAHVR